MAIKSFHQNKKFFAHPIKMGRNQKQVLKDFADLCNAELHIKRPVKLILFQPKTRKTRGSIGISNTTLGVATPSDSVWIRADLPLEETLGILAHELSHLSQLEKNGSKRTTTEQDRKMEKVASDYEKSWRSAFVGGEKINISKRNLYKIRSTGGLKE